MPLDKSLILTQQKKSAALNDPNVARRNRLIARIRNQADIVQREINGEPPLRHYRRLARWYWQEGDSFFLSIQYCRHPLELAKGKWSVQCPDLPAVATALNSPVKMSRFGHVTSHVTATMSAAVSASDAAMITKTIVSAA
jgi:hypothetical protein